MTQNTTPKLSSMTAPKQVAAYIDKVIEAESSEFTNNPNDRGGPTKYGITQNVYNAMGFVGSVEHCTRETAFAIYLKRYWLAPNFDIVQSVYPELAFNLLDWGVTSGPANPVKALQQALNVFNRQQKDYPDILDDGVLGDITKSALLAFFKKRGELGMKYLTNLVIAMRAVFYVGIAERDESQEEFINGWIARTLGDTKL